MKQTGIVVEINEDRARVECDRQSACDMCENSGTCIEKCKKVYATAYNGVGAAVGDTVEIETETGGVLFNAFLVFMMPVFLAIGTFYCLGSNIGEGIKAVITLAVLAVSSALISALRNRSAKKKTVSRITRIL